MMWLCVLFTNECVMLSVFCVCSVCVRVFVSLNMIVWFVCDVLYGDMLFVCVFLFYVCVGVWIMVYCVCAFCLRVFA